MLRIGFDISQTGQNKAGCGYFADGIIRALADLDQDNRYILYPTFGDQFWADDWESSVFRIQNLRFKYGLAHKSHAEALAFWKTPKPDLDARLSNPDILHSNNFFCPVGLANSRLVYTLYDLTVVENPELTTEANRVGCFSGIFNASLYANFIVAISEYTRLNFLRIFPHYPHTRIKTVYPASRFSLDTTLTRPSQFAPLQPGQFWLTVGTIEPRKNHKRLLRAYARLKASTRRKMPLVIAGGKGWLVPDFDQTILALGLQDDVVLTGYTNDQALQWLYQNCFAFVFPSLFEGFGLPVLEAMSLGAAVIASNVTSIPEIVGDAASVIDPLNEESIFEAMRQLIESEDSRQRLGQHARQRAAHFSWKETAEQILAIYESLSDEMR